MAKRGFPFLAWLVSTGLSSAALAQPAQPVGHEFRVNTYATDLQTSPSISSDGDGHFIVVWASDPDPGFPGQDGSESAIIGQRYDLNARRVGAEFIVNTFTTSDQTSPSVSSDPSGNFVVVWTSRFQDGGGGEFADLGVFGQRYDRDGKRLGGEFQVNTYTPDRQSGASVSSDPNGNFVVVWHSQYQDGGGGGYDDWGVFGQRYDRDGNRLGGEFQVNTYTTRQQRSPSVASDGSGNFIVVWAGAPFIADGVFGQRYDSEGNRLGGEFQVSGLQYAQNPSVASDLAGNFVVVWDGLYDEYVFGRRYDSGGNPLGNEFKVSPPPEFVHSTTGAQAVLDASGEFIVVWGTTRLPDRVYETNLVAQRFASDGQPLGRHVQVNERLVEDAFGFPAIAAADRGGNNHLVVWTGTPYLGKASSDIRGRRIRKGASIGPAEVTAVVVKSSDRGYAKAWRQLNDEWRLHGDTSIYIDMTSLGNVEQFTLEHLVETGADVVLINNPVGWLQDYEPSEIEAIRSYASMGHNVIGTYDLFLGFGHDNRGLAPVFGLRSDLSYNENWVDISNIFNVLDPDNYLFRGVPKSWVSQAIPRTQTPLDDLRWDDPDLAGAAIVAEVDNFRGMISVYDGGSYTGIYFSNPLEDSGGALK